MEEMKGIKDLSLAELRSVNRANNLPDSYWRPTLEAQVLEHYRGKATYVT